VIGVGKWITGIAALGAGIAIGSMVNEKNMRAARKAMRRMM